jgi:hypothetical protein
MSAAIVSGDRNYVPDIEHPNERFRFVSRDGSGKLELQVTRDGGESWKAISAEPPSNAGKGWIPSLSEDDSVQWVSPYSLFSQFFYSGAESLTWIDFYFPAELQNNTEFGGFEVPDGISMRATSVQISFFSAPTRSDVQLSFVDSVSGVARTSSINLAAGISLASINLIDEIVLGPGSKTRAKISLGNESGSPGSFLVAKLMVNKI